MSQLPDLRSVNATRLKELWQGLSKSQRLSLVGVLVLGLGLLLATSLGVWQRPYKPLYGDLSAEVASRVVEELQRQDIPYKLQGESRVLVPDDRVYDVRLMLASKNLPAQEGAGFELFDRQDFGVTAFTQEVNYQRALEQELARTIGQIDAVRQARVHLVLPKRQLFKEDQKRPSASVVIQLKDGQRLSPGQIASVQYLVSAAVEGMNARDIAIVDQRGEVLARPQPEGEGQEGGGLGGSPQQQAAELSRRMEGELTERVEQLLAPLVGADRVRARVHVELEPVRVIETAELFDPEQAAVRREQRSEETQSRADADAAGVVGATATLRGAQGEAAQGGAGMSRSNEVIDYEINRTVRQTQQIAPRIRRVSVAVLVDERFVEGAEAAVVAAQQEALSKLVSGAVGLDAARGDSLSLVMQPFKAADAAAAAEAAAAGSAKAGAMALLRDPIFMGRAVRYGALLILALMILLMLVRPALKVLRGAQAPEVAKQAEAKALAEAKAQGATSASGARPPLAVIGDDSPQLVGRTIAQLEQELDAEGQLAVEDLVKKRQRELREQLRLLGQQDPERTAQVIRQWIRMG